LSNNEVDALMLSTQHERVYSTHCSGEDSSIMCSGEVTLLG